jgi:hypothetical protein
MTLHRWVLVSAIAMSIAPAVGAYAAETALRAQPEAASGPAQPQVAPRPGEAPAASPLETRSTGLKLGLGAATEPRRSEAALDAAPAGVPLPRAEDWRSGSGTGAAGVYARGQDSPYGLSGSPAAGTGLTFAPAPSAAKPGWEVSGRVGPLRFLSPLDGEGDARLRFGGRVPGQPRMPGMGLFNVGVHYNFE